MTYTHLTNKNVEQLQKARFFTLCPIYPTKPHLHSTFPSILYGSTFIPYKAQSTHVSANNTAHSLLCFYENEMYVLCFGHI